MAVTTPHSYSCVLLSSIGFQTEAVPEGYALALDTMFFCGIDITVGHRATGGTDRARQDEAYTPVLAPWNIRSELRRARCERAYFPLRVRLSPVLRRGVLSI